LILNLKIKVTPPTGWCNLAKTQTNGKTELARIHTLTWEINRDQGIIQLYPSVAGDETYLAVKLTTQMGPPGRLYYCD